jgi:hypothetical protein
MSRCLNVYWATHLLTMIYCFHATLVLSDTNGVRHRPLELHDQKAVVLIFVGVECPISNSYAPEINRIIKDFKDKGVDFYIVYSDPDVSVDSAKKHAKDFGYTCPGLLDPKQALLNKVKATVTPEAAVVDGQGNVLYLGRIDNWYEDFGKQRYSATVHDLRDALDEIVSGKKVTTPVTRAVGCPV